jgi:hypothetical protein
MAFLYFVEGGSPQMSMEKVAEFGLSYAFDSKPQAFTVPTTPTNSGGCFCYDRKRFGKRSPAYKPDLQKWRRVPGKPVWVGYYTDAPPTAEELKRASTLPGIMLQLGDAPQEWLIPIVQIFKEDSAEPISVLPKRIDLDDSGEWINGDVEAKYKHLEQVAAGFFDPWYRQFKASYQLWMDNKLKDSEGKESTNFDVEFDDPLGRAVEILKANYAIDRVEAVELGLLNNHGCAVILQVACSCGMIADYLKKTADLESATESSNIGDGCEV